MTVELRPTDLTGDDFILGLNYTKDQFTISELAYLQENGKWLSSLENKQATVIPDDAKHFVEVITNGAEPKTEREFLWKKYKAARVEEKKQKKLRAEEAEDSKQYKLRVSRLSAP